MRTYDDVLRDMGRKEGLKVGLKVGLKEGLKMGLKEGVKEVTQNMLALGYSIELIQKATKLPKPAINKLAQSLQSTHSDKISQKLNLQDFA